jgi:hypothetical protein
VIVTFSIDRGVVAYTALEQPQPGDGDVIVAAPVSMMVIARWNAMLGGDPELVEVVGGILTGSCQESHP